MESEVKYYLAFPPVSRSGSLVRVMLGTVCAIACLIALFALGPAFEEGSLFEIVYTALFLPGFVALGWFLNKLVPVPDAVLLAVTAERLHFRFNEGVSPPEIEIANSGLSTEERGGKTFLLSDQLDGGLPMFETLAEISTDDPSAVNLASIPSSQYLSQICHFRISRGQLEIDEPRGLSRY